MSKTNETEQQTNNTTTQQDQIVWLQVGSGQFIHTHTTKEGALKDFTGECQINDSDHH